MLGVVDLVLLFISLLISISIGIYYSIKGLRITGLEYLLGNRSLKPLPVAMSLTVGTVSAITIMGNSGESYTNGTQLWLMDVGMIAGMLVVSYVLIPVFYPLQMVSLYEYIERRFGSKWFRIATVTLTIIGGVVFIGSLISPPSLFLADITGLKPFANNALTGLVCSVYSAFGGVRAVVYTDVFQSVVMIVGALAMVIQGCVLVGGASEVWRISDEHGRIEFFNFDLNPYQNHSFWLVLLHGFFFSVTTFGVNQNQTQRAFCTGSIKYAQRVILYTIFGTLLLRGLFSFAGLVMFATYEGCDPLTQGPYNLPNIAISQFYVNEYLTQIPGLSGLFVSAIYAAVLSSVSTQVNSITALIWEDFLKNRPYFSNWTENKKTNFQKLIALLTGFLGILISWLLASFARYLRAVFTLSGAIWSPMLGLFIVALFLPWVRVKGAAPGFIAGIIVSLWVLIGQLVTQHNVPFLPTSLENCESMNKTIHFSRINSTKPTISDSRIQANTGEGFYGISYCLNHIWGAMTCICLSLIITALTERNEPKDVDQELIHPISWRFFTRNSGGTKGAEPEELQQMKPQKS